MRADPTSVRDFLSRALREEAAAAQSGSPEARLAHEELARLCREQAAEQGRLRRHGAGSLAG